MVYSADFAKVYDAIYTRLKNYEDEARQVRDWIRRFRPDAKTILDVACGTAEHAKYLKADYRIDGLDISENMLAAARAKNPECTYFQGDMKDFDLGQRYDVVMSLFSSIGYMLTTDDLGRTIRAFAHHLNDGGLIIVEPWLTPERWKPGRPHMVAVDEPDFKVCRMNTTETRDGWSYIEFHTLVGTPPQVRHFTETHALALFTVEEMKAGFAAEDLKVQYDEKGIFGRGLYLAERA